MVSVAPAPARLSAVQRARRSAGMPWPVYGLLGLLLLGYLVSLLVRHGGGENNFLDGWMVAAFEATASVLCLACALRHRHVRLIASVLGAAALSWSVGDFLLAAESAGGATPPSPSLADFFYLGFYPLAYAAVVLLVRRQVARFFTATWLDGAIAGLGAAAICAAFIVKPLLHTTGDTALAGATNLAYPVGDLLLLALVVGSTAILPGRRRAPWVLFASACALNAVGDTFNLLQSTLGAPAIGSIFDGIAWPSAILMLSTSVWLLPERQPRINQEAPSFTMPMLGSAAALVVLFSGTFHNIGPAGLALATAALFTAGLRFALSLLRLRGISEERQRQAFTDELTGLGNRRQLQDVLDGFFRERVDDPTGVSRLAFLFIDLDRFKEINDAFGHSAGDELLRQIGPRLKGLLRGSDQLVRVGGDELGVLLFDTDANYAVTVAERLTARLREPFLVGAVRVRISASVGIALAPTDAEDCAGLMRCADLAMYRAKATGSSVRFYQREIDDEGNRLRLVQELRNAVESGEFLLHYQPQVDLQSGDVRAVEALLRWPHPRLGMVPPLEFLPLAEDAGLMPALTALVLDQALSQCCHWRAEGNSLSVSVNISATNLLDPGFLDLVRNTLERYRLPADALILEITETTVLSDFDSCRLVIEQLRDLGLDVSIDDFGAGFTSLAYLGSLAVRELKLDRTFITHLTGDNGERDVALVRATIELGHALGLRVVAEGIEDSATLEVLTRAGCDLAQGYYISKPVPATQLVLSPGAADFAGELRAS